MNREFIIARDRRRVDGRYVCDIMERASATDPWQVILVIAEYDATTVLAALRLAYQNGREDHAADVVPVIREDVKRECERLAADRAIDAHGMSGAEAIEWFSALLSSSLTASSR